MLAQEKGLGLPTGWVPETSLWLIDEGEFVGSVSIRHRLTEKLLQEGGYIGYSIRPSKRKMGYGTKALELAIPVARQLGIEKILVTCNDENLASRKIIEKNGGVLEDVREVSGVIKRRYWIQ